MVTQVGNANSSSFCWFHLLLLLTDTNLTCFCTEDGGSDSSLSSKEDALALSDGNMEEEGDESVQVVLKQHSVAPASTIHATPAFFNVGDLGPRHAAPPSCDSSFARWCQTREG